MAAKITRCKYCGAPLAADGYCSRPCKMGDLERKKSKGSK